MDNIRCCSCCDYFNPCSDRFEDYKFCKLTCCQQLATVVCTIVGLAGCGIGSLAAYRRCLVSFTKKTLHHKAPTRFMDDAETPKAADQAAKRGKLNKESPENSHSVAVVRTEVEGIQPGEATDDKVKVVA